MQVCKTTRERSKVLRRLLALVAFFAALLLVVAIAGRVRSSVQNMPVYVSVLTNPTPQFAAALGSNTNCFVDVPYAQAANKLVTEADLKLIKEAIPRSKTIGRLFSPRALVIKSPTEVEAEFWRRRTPLWMTLVKTGEVWRVEYLGRNGQIDWVIPPGFLDKLEKKLPF